MKPCKKCGGTAYIQMFAHNQGGRCFACLPRVTPKAPWIFAGAAAPGDPYGQELALGQSLRHARKMLRRLGKFDRKATEAATTR